MPTGSSNKIYTAPIGESKYTWQSLLDFGGEMVKEHGVDIAKGIVGGVVGRLLSSGDRKIQEDARKWQMGMAEDLRAQNAYRAMEDKRLRTPLFTGLINQMNRPQPRFVPGRVPLTNPYRDVREYSRTPGVPASTGATPRPSEFTSKPVYGEEGDYGLSSALQRVGYSSPPNLTPGATSGATSGAPSTIENQEAYSPVSGERIYAGDDSTAPDTGDPSGKWATFRAANPDLAYNQNIQLKRYGDILKAINMGTGQTVAWYNDTTGEWVKGKG